MNSDNLSAALDAVRATSPLVHNITNYVTVNDCANALLAIGASPIMSDEPEDVVDITSICNALVINIGTLNHHSIEGMFAAGRHATALGHPIVLDPVGAGASGLRTDIASRLLDELDVSVVRGNMSEVKALAAGSASTRGVDVCPEDVVTHDNLAQSAQFARDFAARAQTVVAITGPIDIIADAKSAFAVENGTPWQGRITGAGCMLSSIAGAFAAARNDCPLHGALPAVCCMGVAGDIAAARMVEADGNGSFRTFLLDALCNLDGATLGRLAKVEEL